MWISPPKDLSHGTITLEAGSQSEAQQAVLQTEAPRTLTGALVRALRTEKGWSQRKLSLLTGLSQGLISLIENDQRSITPENQLIMERTFGLNR
jgi:ribosome-binding protein aMBF1 (putative translation factor)